MQIPVIHFTNLDELLAELQADGRQFVRVATAQSHESKGGQFPYNLFTVAVDVRCLHRGAILSYRALQEEIRTDYMTDREQARQRYNQAWDDAIKVKTAICATIRDAGHEARPGIIDLGEVQPVRGEQWPLHEDVEF